MQAAYSQSTTIAGNPIVEGNLTIYRTIGFKLPQWAVDAGAVILATNRYGGVNPCATKFTLPLATVNQFADTI